MPNQKAKVKSIAKPTAIDDWRLKSVIQFICTYVPMSVRPFQLVREWMSMNLLIWLQLKTECNFAMSLFVWFGWSGRKVNLVLWHWSHHLPKAKGRQTEKNIATAGIKQNVQYVFPYFFYVYTDKIPNITKFKGKKQNTWPLNQKNKKKKTLSVAGKFFIFFRCLL